MPVFRFAPTPNGFLHLGHAYSALRNAALAEKTGGRLLLRFEDVDPARCRPEFEAAILEDLGWLGVSCEPNPRRQSEHGADYAAALARLRAMGLTCPCRCTRGEILRRTGERDPDGAPLHRGRCVCPADGTPANLRLDGESAAARAGTLCWTEFDEGGAPREVEVDLAAWGDVVVSAVGRVAPYHLAVVVDDAAQGVTDVVRGRDLFPSTSVHRVLQALLGLPAPRYRHHRLVRDADGAKLSKSEGSEALRALRGKGFSARDIRRALGFEEGATPLRASLS